MMVGRCASECPHLDISLIGITLALRIMISKGTEGLMTVKDDDYSEDDGGLERPLGANTITPARTRKDKMDKREERRVIAGRMHG